MRDFKSFIDHLPNQPGIYQMLGDKNEIIYVGKAKNLKKRIASYFSKHTDSLKTQSLVSQIKDIDITVTKTENEAVLLECNLIKKHRPRYNVLLRDDKSYPYILVSLDPYPRIDIYRGQRKKNASYFGPYPSSFAVREAISLLQKLFKLRTCENSFFAARARPCLLYQINRCSGPCVNLISKTDYQQNIALAILFLKGKSNEVIQTLQHKMETAASALDYENASHFRDQINRLRQLQDKQHVNVAVGNADVLGMAVQSGVTCIQLLNIRDGQVLGSRAYFPSVPQHATQDEILMAFLTQHYFNHVSHKDSIPNHILLQVDLADKILLENVLCEQSQHNVSVLVPSRGEKKQWLDMAIKSAQQSLAAHLFNKINMQERVIALQQLLQLKKMPKRVECFDISHTLGEATVASCVVFNQSGPSKSDYRRFNISNITPGDDVAAMYQVLSRRFSRLQKEEGVLPDVILIDGGKTQLAAAHKVMQELHIDSVSLVGVSKGPGRKAGFESLHRLGLAAIHLPADSLALHYIQHIRDEAHRFAVLGHRRLRDKKRRQSTLETISGIGSVRRRELLRYFGGIQGVAHASLDELVKVPGINRSLAERIFAALHDATI